MRPPKTSTRSQRPKQTELDRRLDEALENTYPASDPVALSLPHRTDRPAAGRIRKREG